MGDVTLILYDVKEVGSDFVVLTDNRANVKITFADGKPKTGGELPPTKEEQAACLKGIVCQVGLEVPVVPFKGPPRTINIFLDHSFDFGKVRSVPFQYTVASIEVGPAA